MSLLTLVLLTASPDPALLQKLAAHTAALETFASHARVTVETTADELDGDGKVTSSKHFVVRQTRDGEKLTRTLVSAEENGKDVTEKQRSELEQKPKRGPVRSPFHPEEQPRYRFTQRDETHVAFEPLTPSDENFVGEATIDPAAATVQRMTLHIAKLPAMVDQLDMTLLMEAPTPAGNALSRLTLQGKAGVLMFKKRFRVTTTLRNYEAL